MGHLDEIVSRQFSKWEQMGRGWKVWSRPVALEPPFQPFRGFVLPSNPTIDDGRKPAFLASIFDSIHRQLNAQPPIIEETEEEPEPELLYREPLVELPILLPAKLDISQDSFERLLGSLALCNEPIAFELIGSSKAISIQLAAHPEDMRLVRRQLLSNAPYILADIRQSTLEDTWDACESDDIIVMEFGLAEEFMLPLAIGKFEQFIPLIAALSEVGSNELAVFQVLFHPTEHPWPESVERAISDVSGKPLFVNRFDLVKGAEIKLAKPLYAVVVRLALRTGSRARTRQIARDVAASLSAFAKPDGNRLIALSNDEYPFEDHVEDLLARQTRRSGMILNSEELAGLVHLPSSDISSPALVRESGRTKLEPAGRTTSGICLGTNIHAGRPVSVHLSIEERLRHCHILGASGTGKSTLLTNLIEQDIAAGNGVAVLDPHGDLIDRILAGIPSDRINDVILIDPSDEQYSVGFNILSAHSDLEKSLLASDLVSVFQRLSTSWGDQMGSVLQNAILAFLESPSGGTLSDLRRFLIEPAFRNEVLRTVRDPDIVYYWRKAFPQLSGNRSIGPVLTRLDTFLSPKPIRYIVSQPTNKLDFADILDSGKILLAKLSQGQIGKENSYLLGSLLLAKFQQTAMSRQAKAIEARRPYFLYADEFPNFISPSLAEILAGARKYGLGLILAHQELHQLEKNQDVQSAVMANSYTRIIFRMGDSEARTLENGLSFFDAKALQNLETGQAICRIEKADNDFNLSVSLPLTLDPEQADARREAVIAASRARYAVPRSEIESALLAKSGLADTEEEPLKTKAVARSVPKKEVPPVETPKEPTVSEKKKPAPVPPQDALPASQPKEVCAPEPPRSLGRGGEQHKAIQERIQKEAHALGFSAEIEKQLKKGSNHSADLVLRKGDVSIAVEITVTTTTDHEFGNVKKCVENGFSRIAVVSSSPERLEQIKVAVMAGLGAGVAAKVEYHSPDALIQELRTITSETPAPKVAEQPKERIIRGWKVRRFGAAQTENERKANEAAIMKIIMPLLKPKS
ncbi:MAG TPA: type IV secretion system DNA-binding domain-containing protein [Verrucomicrobiae bacterium]|nr:type IV secretion system DNA-binding domain-containing protein [Verrucomicrobiae bacterium]